MSIKKHGSIFVFSFTLVTIRVVHLKEQNPHRYGNSSGRVRGGPAFWFENLTAEIRKIVN